MGVASSQAAQQNRRHTRRPSLALPCCPGHKRPTLPQRNIAKARRSFASGLKIGRRTLQGLAPRGGAQQNERTVRASSRRVPASWLSKPVLKCATTLLAMTVLPIDDSSWDFRRSWKLCCFLTLHGNMRTLIWGRSVVLCSCNPGAGRLGGLCFETPSLAVA
jgi:hypothetical protein